MKEANVYFIASQTNGQFYRVNRMNELKMSVFIFVVSTTLTSLVAVWKQEAKINTRNDTKLSLFKSREKFYFSLHSIGQFQNDRWLMVLANLFWRTKSCLKRWNYQFVILNELLLSWMERGGRQAKMSRRKMSVWRCIMSNEIEVNVAWSRKHENNIKRWAQKDFSVFLPYFSSSLILSLPLSHSPASILVASVITKIEMFFGGFE